MTATIFDKIELFLGHGSQISVANAALLEQVQDSLFVAGQVAFVQSYGDFFSWRPGRLLATHSGVVLKGATGQWVRMGIPNEAFLSALFWAIDPVNGSDENQGWGTTQTAAEAVPLKTRAEFDRRLAGNPGFTASILIRILGDIPLSDAGVCHNIKAGASASAYPVFSGKIGTALTTGTMAGYTAKNTGAGTGQTYLINLTSAATYVGKMVQDEDRRWAFVLGAASANVAQVSTPMREVAGVVETAGFPGEPSDFVNGKTFGIYDLYRLPAYPFASYVEYGAIAQLKIGQAVVSNFSNPNLGSSAPYIMKSIIETGTQANNGTSGSWTGGFPDWSGNLFYGTGGSSAVSFLNHAGNFHCCAWLNCAANFFNGSGARLQEEAMLYGSAARILLDETSTIGGITGSTPRLQVGVFGTTNPAFSGGRVRLPSDGGTVYGASNTSTIFSVPQGSSYSVPKAGCTAVTSGNALSVGGTAKAFSDVPFINATNNASISDGT